MKVKISVIIPVYNVEKYLEECLNSVVNQTLKEIEIICVNDGSTDSSTEIIDRYANKYKNIKVINQKNAGLSAARNSGYKMSKGKYIYFLDSDDYLKDLNVLSIILKECEKEELDIALFGACVSSENDNFGTEYNIDYSKYLGSNVMSGRDIFNTLIENNCYIHTVWLRVFKREFLESLNISFYEGIIYEDILYSVICDISAKRVKYIGELFYTYRIRKNSIMTRGISEKSIDGYYISGKKLYEFLGELFLNVKDKRTIENLKVFIKHTYKKAILCCDALENIEMRKEIISNIDKELIDVEIDIIINYPILYYNLLKNRI